MTDRNPLVSVVIPTFNRSATIWRALNSVLSQEIDDLEVIVVDDGSTDDTQNLLANIADPRLRLLQTDGRRGAPVARNVGIAAARGEWIAFQDSDDEWCHDKLTKQLQALAGLPTAQACYCRLIQRYGQSDRLIPVDDIGRDGSILPTLVKGSFISTQTLMVSRNLLQEIGGFDPALPRLQDWDLVIRLAKRGVEFAFASDPLVIAYETPGSLTSNAMKAVDARDIIFEKHPDLIANYPREFARQFFIMASLSLKGRQRSRASKAITRARELDPLSLRYILFALRLFTSPRR